MKSSLSRRITRREAIAAAGAVVAAPRILLAQDKSGLKNPVLGSGDNRYEAIHDWAQPPKSMKFGNTHGVCEDAQGRIYIKQTVGAGSESADAIAVFDADGKFISSWGKEYKGGAHGLHIRKEGSDEYLYLCDCVRGVWAKTDLKGNVVYTRTAPMECGKYENPSEFKPTNVAIAPSGEIFVADGYGKSWIHIYNGKGEYQSTFGGPGKDAGQVSCPHGLMVDTRGAKPELVVADRSNRRLQYFSLDGKHLRFVTDELRSPCHFHERDGVLLIPDLEARVTLFNKDNKLIAHLGDGTNFALRDKPREQFVPGKFVAPHSAIFDRKGDIYVVEWVEVGRVTKLKRMA
jgi:DNA-binding beta-propeller fold protein YncE